MSIADPTTECYDADTRSDVLLHAGGAHAGGSHGHAGCDRANYSRARLTTNFVGIDIGDDVVRVATIRLSQSGQTGWDWFGMHQFDVPKCPGGELTPGWLASFIDSIPERLPRCIDGDRNVTSIALPISWTHYQTIVGHEVAEARYRCSEIFSQSVFESEAHVCHWPVVGVHHGFPGAEDQYVIAATAKRAACQISDLVSSLGYNVQSILPHGVALAHGAKELTDIDAQCVLWLSRTSALITVRHRTGVGLARTLPTIPKRLLEQDQPDRPLDAYTIRPYLSEIADEYRATSRYAARADMSRVSEKPILIAGPIAAMQGVDEAIATISRTPVAVWSFDGPHRPAQVSQGECLTANELRRRESSYAGALSLALAASRSSNRGYGR